MTVMTVMTDAQLVAPTRRPGGTMVGQLVEQCSLHFAPSLPSLSSGSRARLAPIQSKVYASPGHTSNWPGGLVRPVLGAGSVIAPILIIIAISGQDHCCAKMMMEGK